MVLVTKVMIFVLIFAILYIIKECASFGMSFAMDKPMGLTNKRLIFIGLALSYIITIIFTGFNIW